MASFLKLGLPRVLELNVDVLEGNFREKGKVAHPDAGGAADEFEKLRAAYEELKSPARRIRSVLGPEEDRGVVPSEVMNLFGPVAEAIQAVDDFLRERASARSALGRAVLDVRIPELKQGLERLTGQLLTLEEGLIGRFSNFDSRGWENCSSEMGEVARGLVFIENWLGQLRGAMGKLFEALLGGMS
ncbi:hypothetical protein N9Q98_00200 [bacterium]|nr:hypothetical protein [bacterium]